MWTIIITIAAAAATAAVMMIIIIKSQGEQKKEVRMGKGHSTWLWFYPNNNQSLNITQ